MDRFLFEKLDNISDEAYKVTGEDIPIILICSDRRTKSDGLLIKLFGIGVYNALLGNDRNVDMVCNLINKPRSKKEAKNYYLIDSEEVNYKPENESEVSETEIKNILNHYKKIGSNEKKCVESFESIASQYNDTQLRIIIKFLPDTVKSILEKRSQRYQKLVNGGTVLTGGGYTPYSPLSKDVKKKDMDFITTDIDRPKLTQPVVIPSSMDIKQSMPVKQNNRIINTNSNMIQPITNPYDFSGTQNNNMQNSPINNIQNPGTNNMQNPSINNNQNPGTNNVENPSINNIQNLSTNNIQNQKINDMDNEVAHVKRRGRPRKVNIDKEKDNNQTNNELLNLLEVQPAKRGRGRPKKVNVVAEDLEQNNINNDNYNSQNSEHKTDIRNKETDYNLIDNGDQSSEENKIDQNLSGTTALAEQNSFNLFDLGSDVQDSTNVKEDNNPIVTNSDDINLFGIADDNMVQQQTTELQMTQQQTVEPQITQPQTVEPRIAQQQTIENQYDQGNIAQNPYDTTGFINAYTANESPYGNQNNYINDTIKPYENNLNQGENYFKMENTREISRANNQSNISQSNFVAQNKIVAFVGTSKNGTSFIVNNLAELLSQKGIKTAILDLTKNKNSYYMFTDNDQRLMQIATQSIKNLEKGVAQGVEVNKNLTVYTSLPDEFDETENFETILQTLDNNYSAILLDCDFNTNINYFIKATEIYLVQSMDALTIQPLTQFLSELKVKNVLEESKLRVIINKEVKLKILNDKMILGGMAKYNEPSMTLQRDLFNPTTIKYVTIPFEMQTYSRYLEAIALCQISLSGYSANFMTSLENLANMVYPLVTGGTGVSYSKYSPNYEKAEKKGFFKSKSKKQPPTQFSAGVNGTLDKMRANY